MISDDVIERWSELLSDADGIQFMLGLVAGQMADGKPPYPSVLIEENSEMQVRRFVCQTMKVKAEEPETESVQRFGVFRLVAELENDQEIEIIRTVKKIDEEEVEGEQGSMVCAACDEAIIDSSEVVEMDGHQYHRRCV